MKIESVQYVGGYALRVKFQDGVEGEVNLSDLVEEGIFKVLQDQELFSKAYSTGYSLAWSEELEIDANNLYMEVSGSNVHELKAQNPAHAPN
jgi:DUF971 family protein